MPSDQICKICKMAAVTGCPNTLEYPGGASIMRVEGDEVVSDVCPNMKIVALRQRLLRLDPQLLKVKHDSTTPLYQNGQFDRTEDNLLLTQADWRVFLSHFKWVLGNKDPKYFVRIVTDATLKQVYMGEASVRARLPEQREDSELAIFNSLEDLLALPNLIIIRVGFVVYFNRAMASILHEALLLRLGVGKATWIVEPAGYHFKPYSKGEYGISSGMPCCDADVAQLVEAQFESIQLGEVEPPTEEHDGGVTARGVPEPLEDTSPTEDETEETEPETEGTPKDPDEERMDLLTRRRPQRKPYKRKGWS